MGYLKEDLISRFYDLMRDIILNQDKDSSIHELDPHFKYNIDSIYQGDRHMKQDVEAVYKEEFFIQAIWLEKESLKY